MCRHCLLPHCSDFLPCHAYSSHIKTFELYLKFSSFSFLDIHLFELVSLILKQVIQGCSSYRPDLKDQGMGQQNLWIIDKECLSLLVCKSFNLSIANKTYYSQLTVHIPITAKQQQAKSIVLQIRSGVHVWRLCNQNHFWEEEQVWFHEQFKFC